VTYSVTLGDVDADEDLDLVCSNHDQSSTLYLNLGARFGLEGTTAIRGATASERPLRGAFIKPPALRAVAD
jgi:hypothetical protein